MSDPQFGAVGALPQKPSILETGLAKMQASLSKLPPGKRAAIVAIADEDGIRFGAAARLNDEWALSAELEAQWREKPTGQISVRWSK